MVSFILIVIFVVGLFSLFSGENTKDKLMGCGLFFVIVFVLFVGWLTMVIT